MEFSFSLTVALTIATLVVDAVVVRWLRVSGWPAVAIFGSTLILFWGNRIAPPGASFLVWPASFVLFFWAVRQSSPTRSTPVEPPGRLMKGALIVMTAVAVFAFALLVYVVYSLSTTESSTWLPLQYLSWVERAA